jgi:hypothetical protein
MYLEKTLSKRSLGVVGGNNGGSIQTNLTPLITMLFHHLHKIKGK